MPHDKVRTPRTFDDDGYRRRAGCICFKTEAEMEVLLITRLGGIGWTLPGGGIEPMEDPRDAALREAYEEAGIKGKPGRFVGCFENASKNYRIHLYTATVTDMVQKPDWMEGNRRQRKWFGIEEAIERLANKPWQQIYLRESIESKSRDLMDPSMSYTNYQPSSTIRESSNFTHEATESEHLFSLRVN